MIKPSSNKLEMYTESHGRQKRLKAADELLNQARKLIFEAQFTLHKKPGFEDEARVACGAIYALISDVRENIGLSGTHG